jgi:hypothetical protein
MQHVDSKSVCYEICREGRKDCQVQWLEFMVKWAGKVRATTLFAMKKLVKLASKFEPWLSKKEFFFLLEVVEATIHKTLFSILGSPIHKC